MSEVNSGSGKEQVRCDYCGQLVSRRNLKKHHAKVHRTKTQSAPCPQCKKQLRQKGNNLKQHFLSQHGREPSPGEARQFKNFKETEAPYSDRDFVKPKNEVSGGAVSPR